MQATRLLLLIVLVTGLGLLAWRLSESESQAEVQGSRKLAPQIESSRLTRLVVERPETEDRFILERNGRGTWFLTEPVAWAAESGVVRGLIDNIRNLPAEVMTGLDEAEAELVPGRIRLELTERIGERDKRWLVRVGRFDLGDDEVFCSVQELGADGEPMAESGAPEILRVPRPIFDTPMAGYDFFRSRRLASFEPNHVVAIRRRGALSPPTLRIGPDQGAGPKNIAELDATIEASGVQWLSTEPFRSRLEPGVVHAFLLVASQLRAEDFLDDNPSDPARYGFDPPWFEVEFDLGDGTPVTFEFGSESALADRAPGQRVWYTRQKGLPNVFTIRPGTIYTFAQPLEEMVDANLFQVRREDVEHFELVREGVGLHFEREGKSGWTVRASEQPAEEALPADPGLTQDVLASLESASTATLLPLDQSYEPVGTLSMLLDDDSQPVVEFAERIDYLGVEGTPVRRRGEEVWGLCVEDLGRAAGDAAGDYLSRVAFDVPEFELFWFEAEGLGRERKWNREGRSGVWQPDGVASEDRQFSLLVDRLRAPIVRQWRLDLEPQDVLPEVVPGAETEAARIALRLDCSRRGFDPQVDLAPGLDEDGGRVTYLVYEGRVGEASPELYDDLEELLLVVGRPPSAAAPEEDR